MATNSQGKKATHIHFEPLEPRILFDAVPEVAVSTEALTVAEDQLVNDDIEFTVEFDNTGDQVGFAPYVDIVAPPEVQINSINLTGTEQTNPDGLATEPIGEIGNDGQLIEIGSSASPVPIDHPMFESSIGTPPDEYYGGAGSGTTPVTYDVVTTPSLIGQYVYNVELPFGSYSQDNPALSLTVNASLNTADGIVPNQSYGITAQGGFALGHTALNDPGTVAAPDDAPIFGASATSDVMPMVMQLTKTAAVPEEDGTYIGELASGPNHPVTYTLSIDVATGETVNGLSLTDVIPGDLAYLGNLQVLDSGGNPLAFTTNDEPLINSDGLTGTPASDNLLDLSFGSVTGVSGTDITITYEAFIPFTDGESSAAVIDPETGEQLDISPYNDAQITGLWNGNPVSDNEGPAGASQDGVTGNLETDYVLEEHSLAIQKGVANIDDRNAAGNSPQDILEYTLNFQVSDYFAFEDLVVDDLLGDGQDFLPGDARGGFVTDGSEIIPQLTYTQHGETITVDFDSANFTSVVNADGSTSIQFDVYSQLQASHTLISGGDPILGGLVPSGGLSGGSVDPSVFNAGATTGTITYRVQIRNSHTVVPGEQEISQGDELTNTVTISGENLDIDDLTRHNQTVTDGSSSSVSIPVGSVSKEVVAITSHGTTTLNPVDYNVSAGDLVSYRISYELPTTEFESLRLEDFLPLPIFDASSIDDSQVYDFDAGTAYTTAGRISFGSGDTFYGSQGPDDTGDGGIDDSGNPSLSGLDPVIDLATFASSNGFVIEIGDYSLGANDAVSSTIEFIVTVEILDAEYADGLQFTNQVGASEANSFLSTASSSEMAQIILEEPELSITKGVVSTTHPTGVFDSTTGPAGTTFAAPGSASAFSGNAITSDALETQAINANLSAIDAGDLVTFVITVENTGNSSYGAFDVVINDTMPAGFIVPSSGAGLNLRVTDGNGTALTTSGDLFGAGLELTDPSAAQGSLTAYDGASGSNIAIIAYDLLVDSTATALETLTNTAEIVSYSHSEGGTDHADDGELVDTASVTTVAPILAKSVVSTSHNTAANSDSEAVIGEIITYEVTVTIPEGDLEQVEIVDLMDNGLAFVDFLGVTAVSGDLSSSLGALSSITAIVTDPGTTQNSGNTIELGFGSTPGLGTITNTNTDNATAETLTFQYRAVVLNHTGNSEGTRRNNDANLSWNVNGGTQTVDDQASNITIREADIDVSKVVSNANAMADETVTYEFTVTNNGSVEAYDIVLSDVLPEEINSATNLQYLSGVVPDSLTFTPGAPEGTISASWATLAVGESAVFSIDVTVDTGLDVNTTVTNTATATWTSLPGDPGVISTHNQYSIERSGDTSDPLFATQNDYSESNDAAFVVPNPQGDKAIIDTSEGHTSNDTSAAGQVNAVPGEIIRYEVTIDLPQGNMTNLSLVDTLEAGLQFLAPADNNVTVQLNGFDAGGGTYVAADLPANVHTSAQTLDPGQITVNGQIITFDFGQITNNETDSGSAESLTISYNVIVSNDDGTNVFRGNTLTNSAQVQVNGVDSGSPATIDANVVQPQVSISKSDNGASSADAGDVISYTLTITADSNINAATAYDLNITDTLPAELEIDGGSLTFSGLPGYVVTSSLGVVGQDITAFIDQLEAGDSFEITFDARVRDSGTDQIGAGQTVTNTANLTYSSLPGSGTADGSGDNATGSVAGASGDTDGERVYTDADSESFSSPDATISKVLATPADTTYTIGETVEYVLTITVPEGQTDNAVVVDALEAGMSYISGTLTVTAGAGITVTTAGPYDDTNNVFFTRTDPGTTSDEQLQLDFGTIEFNEGASGDGLATQTIEIRYSALVDNIASNQNNVVRSNIADLNWTDGSGAAQVSSDSTPDDDTDITIVEPDLSVTKSITNDVSGLDAGDTVTYQILVQHTGSSTADAFDLDLSDALPDGILENFTLVSATLDAADVSGSFNIDGSNDLVQTGNLDLAQGEVLTLTITGQVRDDANPSDAIANTANLTWSGIDGTDSGERDGSGGVNDYSDSDSANTSVQGVLDVTKSIPAGTTEVLVGDTITYQLEVSIAEGTLTNLSIVDTLPDGMTLDLGSVQISNINGMTVTDFAAAQVGQVLTITASSVLNPGNSDDSTTSDTDSFFITYDATASDDPVNVYNTAVLTNDADASADGVSDDNDNQVSVTVVEPVLEFEKTLTGADSGDAGDVFNYTFTINHDATSGADAMDVILTDTIPSGFQLVPGSINGTGATPDPDLTTISGTGTGLAGETITLRWETIPQSIDAANPYEVTMQFVMVDSITDLSSNIVNSATLNYDHDPDDGAGRSATPIVSAADPVDPDLAYAFTKSVISTSENGDLGGQGDPLLQDLVIGEEVTFELVATFGEGTTTDVVITDTLPFTASNGTANGVLELVSGTITSIGSGITSISSGLSVSDSGTVTGTSPDVIEFDFGDIVAEGNNADDSTITIRITARVANVVQNQTGDLLTNDGELSIYSGAQTFDDQASVEVFEPQIVAGVFIDSIPAEPDSGDTVSYEATITNPTQFSAYDSTYVSSLPTEIALQTGTFTAISNISGDVSASFTALTSGVTSNAPFTLAAGETITFTYDALLTGAVTDGSTYTNNVQVDWTSIDGANANERTGDDGQGGALDDYEANASVSFTTEVSDTFAFDKVFVSGDAAHTGITEGTSGTIPDLVIGEVVTYQLVATIGNGTTTNVSIVDQLDPTNGLLHIQSATVTGGSNLTSDQGIITGMSPSITDTDADTYDDRIVLNLGTITNTGTSGTVTDSQVIITVQALVVNDGENQDGDVIRNTGQLYYDSDIGAQMLSDFEDVEIVEPDVTVSKTLTSATTNVDSGDAITWNIVIEHTGASTADARDLVFSDLIPSGVTVDFSSGVTITESVAGNIKTSFELVGNELRTVSGGYDLALGRSISIAISGVLNNTVEPNQVIQNEATVQWTSLDGSSTEERNGDGTGANDYTDTATAATATVIEELSLDKRLPSGASTTYAVGETVTFELEVTIMEGTTPALVLQDRLPAGMRYVTGSATLDAGQSNALISIGAISETWVSGTGLLTLDLGDVVNSSTNNGSDDSFVITYQTIVENVATNQGGTTLTNDATVDAEDVNDAALPQDQDQVSISLVEPELDIQKTVDNLRPKLGETLTYTLTIENTGGLFPADAFDIDVLDSLPSELVLDPSSIQLTVLGAPANPTTITANNSTASALAVVLNRLDIGESVELTFEATVTSSTSDFDSVIVNNAELEWTSTAGTNSDERTGDPADPGGALNDYNDTDSETVEVFQPDLRISKDDGGATFSPSGDVTYTLSITNIGRADALGVEITDDISEFLQHGFTPIGSSPVGTLSGGIITIALPDIVIGDTVEVTISLAAPAVIPAGLESITNTANVTHLDIDPTPANNTDDEETPVIASPDLVVTKTDGRDTAEVGETLTYTLSYTNVGNQISSGVVLTDTLPTGVEFLAASDGGRYSGSNVTWNLGQLAPGQSGSVTVSVRVWNAGVILNTVTIKDDGSGGPDPSPANNRDTDTTLITPVPIIEEEEPESEDWPVLQFDTIQNFLFGEDNQRGYLGNDSFADSRLADGFSEKGFSSLGRHFGGGDHFHLRLPTSIAHHMNSGLVQPGSTVVLEVYNQQGQLIGSSQTVADSGGNWVITFQSATIDEAPHTIVMRQTAAVHNASDTTGYNFRTYFGPTYNSGTYYTSELTQQDIFTLRSAQQVLQVYNSSESIIQLCWNSYRYEFASQSGLTGLTSGC